MAAVLLPATGADADRLMRALPCALFGSADAKRKRPLLPIIIPGPTLPSSVRVSQLALVLPDGTWGIQLKPPRNSSPTYQGLRVRHNMPTVGQSDRGRCAERKDWVCRVL
jgi:hypothetical protein